MLSSIGPEFSDIFVDLRLRVAGVSSILMDSSKFVMAENCVGENIRMPVGVLVTERRESRMSFY